MHPRDKTIRYEVHAIHRMRRRGINETQVEQTIREPTSVRSAKRPGAKRFERKISARKRLVVIAEESNDSYWVITAWKG